MGDAVGYQDQHDPIPTQSAAVEDALGSVLDKVQDSLQFPSGSALKPSLSYGYGFQTQLYFTLEPKWEILPQLALQWVRFDVSISKTRHYSGILAIQLQAFLVVGDVNLEVKGTIPELQEGVDTEISLSLKAQDPLDSIPTWDLLQQCASTDGSAAETRKAADDLIKQLDALDEPEAPAEATLTIIRSATTHSYFLKRFEIRLVRQLDLELIPQKISMQRAAVALHFPKDHADDKFDAYLGADGRFLLRDSLQLDLQSKLLLAVKRSGYCLGWG